MNTWIRRATGATFLAGSGSGDQAHGHPASGYVSSGPVVLPDTGGGSAVPAVLGLALLLLGLRLVRRRRLIS